MLCKTRVIDYYKGFGLNLVTFDRSLWLCVLDLLVKFPHVRRLIKVLSWLVYEETMIIVACNDTPFTGKVKTHLVLQHLRVWWLSEEMTSLWHSPIHKSADGGLIHYMPTAVLQQGAHPQVVVSDEAALQRPLWVDQSKHIYYDNGTWLIEFSQWQIRGRVLGPWVRKTFSGGSCFIFSLCTSRKKSKCLKIKLTLSRLKSTFWEMAHMTASTECPVQLSAVQCSIRTLPKTFACSEWKATQSRRRWPHTCKLKLKGCGDGRDRMLP